MSYSVVSGANRGLGLEMVRQLLERGERVIAACRKPTQARSLTALSGAFPGHLRVIPLDVANERSISAFAAEVRLLDAPIELLINNAGLLVSGERFGKLESKPLHDSFATNAIGPLLMVQALRDQFSSNGLVRIVNISSQIGSIANTLALRNVSYAMSKAALNMATRLLAAELAPAGIAVVCMHPGWVQTEMGGASAPLEIAEAVTALLERIGQIQITDAGRFIDSAGNNLLW